MITFSDFDSHTNPLSMDLKILKVYDVIKLQQLKLAYEYCYDLIPNDLRNLFNCNSEIHINSLTSLRSVQNKCLIIPPVKTVHSGEKSLKYQCANLWTQFMTKPISLQAIPKTYEKQVNPNLDMKKVHNLSQFLSKLKFLPQ